MKIKTIRLSAAPAIFLLAITMLLAGGRLKAQTMMDTPEARANALTEKMIEVLPLADTAEYQKVYTINLAYAKKMAASFKNADSRMKKLRALKAGQKEKDRELKAILTREQFKNYEKLMKEVKQQLKQQYRNRQ